ncbi:MAG: MBL fold metallo-hydrolase, partial [Clostridia bacterium]|nr:MBL fold metallo-hydrolase [Clostridia bacterium]
MKLIFYGAAKGVTGSNHYLETGNTKLLVDCGMFQGGSSEKKMNYEALPYNPAEIDYVILTHAHIDHSGRIPLLYKQGYKGTVICTKPTADLCEIMLPDSAHIQEMDAEYKNRKRQRSGETLLKPLYDAEDVSNSLKHFKRAQYNQIIKVNDDLSIRFKDAGHILGSASVEMWCKEGDKTTKIVFSGDLGKFDTPIIGDPELIDYADYLIMESTYGNKKHLQTENREELMFKIIEETIAKNGTVIIPSFSVGRTQEMIYGFNRQIDLRDRFKTLKNVPVYVDSPLAISATEVFRRNTEVFDEEAKDYIFNGDNPLDFENLIFTQTADESKAINLFNGPKIIISSSGMCDAGRIKHHLKHNLWKENTTVLFVGYQAPGTLGRIILDGAEKVSIFKDIVDVRARIEMIDGFSGHGDMDDLDKFLSGFQKIPGKIFLVHGEDDQLEGFSNRIHSKFNTDAIIPSYGQIFSLSCD